MSERQIGGVAVSALGLGGAKLSLLPHDQQDAVRLVQDALDRGVTLLDTAAAYVPVDDDGHNERLMAQAARGRPDVLVATKGGQTRVSLTEFATDARPTTLRHQCEASLRALEVDQIGLYYLHQVDPAVPIEESVGELFALRDEGKIAQVGVCNVDVDLAARAASAGPISAIQNSFSPFDLSSTAVRQWCAARDVAFVAYSPLGGWGRAPYAEAFPRLVGLAAGLGVAVEPLVLAWAVASSATTVALVGATRPATLHSSLSALALDLSPETIAAVDAAILADDPVPTDEGARS
ncbi:MAG: aldo/keto reductase [Cellulomonadaceae bacterium]|nr:aldo/keto reductase [Cellulomonadaceae bacterium]